METLLLLWAFHTALREKNEYAFGRIGYTSNNRQRSNRSSACSKLARTFRAGTSYSRAQYTPVVESGLR